MTWLNETERLELARAQIESIKTERSVHVVRSVERIVAAREELIADLRARVSHAIAERDVALTAAAVSRAMVDEQAIREAQARAWEDGHRDVCTDCNCPPERNPHTLDARRGRETDRPEGASE